MQRLEALELFISLEIGIKEIWELWGGSWDKQ